MYKKCETIQAGVPTKNDHTYTEEVLQKSIIEFNNRMSPSKVFGRIYGSAIYSDRKDLCLSKISHQVNGVDLIDGEIYVDFKILNTPAGSLLQAFDEEFITPIPIFSGKLAGNTVEDAKLIRIDLTIKGASHE